MSFVSRIRPSSAVAANTIAYSSSALYTSSVVNVQAKSANSLPGAALNTLPDYGVREQVDPDTEASVPVVYGTAYLGGIITDAQLVNNNQTMWYCITICEKTGIVQSTGQPSEITFEAVYWNQYRVKFKTDGVTVESLIDDDGNENASLNGLVRIYAYNDGSTQPAAFRGYGVPDVSAWNYMPEWTTNHAMTDLVFALVRVDYNRDLGATGLGNVQFKIKNNLTQPGDVVYDYMTNPRYGAGIQPEEINY